MTVRKKHSTWMSEKKIWLEQLNVENEKLLSRSSEK